MMPLRHVLLWFWLPTIGYMAAIFGMSSLSRPPIGPETPDYVLHALEYFLLTLLLIRLFLAGQPPCMFRRLAVHARQADAAAAFRAWQQACLLGLTVAILYGMSDECHQYFVPNRHASWHDIAADTFGAVTAYTIAGLDYLLLMRCHCWRNFLVRLKLTRYLSYAAYWR